MGLIRPADVIAERMTPSWMDKLVNFQAAMPPSGPSSPAMPDLESRKLRARLIAEEVAETLSRGLGFDVLIGVGEHPRDGGEKFIDIVEGGSLVPDLVELADGVADATYVLLGTAEAAGIDMEPVFDLVHESNMLKAGGPVRDDGKRLKPEGWAPPDIAGELERQANRRRIDEHYASEQDRGFGCGFGCCGHGIDAVVPDPEC